MYMYNNKIINIHIVSQYIAIVFQKYLANEITICLFLILTHHAKFSFSVL